MNDNELIAHWVKWIVIAFLGFILTIAGSCQTTKYRVVQAIEAGAPPFEAECALTDAMCSEMKWAEAFKTAQEQ